MWILSALLAIIIFIGYLVSPILTTDAPISEPVNLTLGTEKSLLTAAIWIAADQKYFHDEGLNVTIQEFDSGRLSFLTMLDDAVDLSTVAPTPIMFSAFERDDFSILASIVYSDNDVKVIARTDKGIDNIKALAGKRIGTPAGTTGQFFLNALLTYNGVSSTSITEVDFNPFLLPEALEKGDVDAIVIWEPHAMNTLKRLGKLAVTLPSSDIYRETFNLIAKKKLIRKHPEAIARILRSLIRATTFIHNHPEEAIQIVARRLSLNPDEISVLWQQFTFETFIDSGLILELENQSRWAIENSLVQGNKIPNYLNLIHLDALKNIKPQAIDLSK